MDPNDQCPSLFFGITECPAGQDLSSWRYMEEPSRIDGEYYGLDNATCLSIDGAHSGQSSADSYDGLPPFMAPFDGFTHQMNTGLTFDSRERPVNTTTPRQCPYTRNFGKFPGMAHSVPTIEMEYSNEDEQRHICQECNRLFKNLQELDQHAKSVPHKPWKCAEPLCGKMYARRDTFVRHRATHKHKSHACPICSHQNKQKFFTRKDHLKEHIRNCHSKGVEATGVENVRSSGAHLSISNADSGRRDTTGVVVKSEECKQAMDRVVESLQAVMGDDKENILGQLGHSLTALSGPDIQTVASSMAKAALETTRETTIKKSKC